jgi:uncharacterized repeat protein (TIGR03803 family)
MEAAMKAFMWILLVAACLILASCGGSSGNAPPQTPTTYTIGGTVSGLSGTGLVLQDNGGNNLSVSASGSFVFTTTIASGGAYSVTVLTQPSSPAQTCAVTNGSGTASANVTNIQITCITTATYTIGGTVSGLSGTGLVLQDNGGNNLSVSANGSFVFTTTIASGGAYSVTVLTQPSSPAQTCAVTNGSGTASTNVTNIQITCITTATFTIGGTVSGLSGTGLVLQDNGGNNLSVSANGTFTFTTTIAGGGVYSVTVLTQPSSPAQTCAVTNGSGTANANVTSVQINCTPTFTTLYSFNNTDGRNPYAGLVQAANGDLYGTTWAGNHDGNDYSGTVFQMTPGGTPTALYYFCSETNCADGQLPYAGVIQGADGDFYGTTQAGGRNVSCDGYTGCGTIFKINSSGTLTTLYTFCSTNPCTDGTDPYASLVQGSDGNFYGTTEGGGFGLGAGTIFRITPSGTFTTLYQFCTKANCPDGSSPWAGLVQGTDGNFYGTTFYGGTSNSGTVFKITPSGTLTTLYSFTGTDGALPEAGLVQGGDGNFYGTTSAGGNFAHCPGATGCGTVFQITPSGSLKTLYSFCSQTGCPDGHVPTAALVQGSDGNFYGTTEMGGQNGTCPKGGACGTVFQITPTGTLTTLYSFCSQGGISCTDGANPYAALIQDPTNGNFYGTTYAGGASNDGTVFSLNVGLGPF